MQNSILVVDDEKSIREFFSILLRGEGYQVITAEDGEQALAELVLVNSIINAGGTDQLADDYTLSTIDYECSYWSHIRNITHEHFMLK